MGSMKKARGFALAGALVVSSACGSGSGDSGPENSCGVTNAAVEPACNACLRAKCCDAMAACVRGSECAACIDRAGADCSLSTLSEVTAYLGCVEDDCSSECDVGAGGVSSTGGTASKATGGALSNGGSSAGTASAQGGEGGADPCAECSVSELCIVEAGGPVCVPTCRAPADCGSQNACSVLATGDTVCLPLGSGRPELCEQASDCETEACGPWADGDGAPVGPYVCVPNDAAPYHGCSGILTSCGEGYCCFTDALENQFCGRPCESAAECGGADCNEYDNSNTSCAATRGCGPL